MGWFYQFATEHAGLGDWTNAGKLMGLAAYGQPRFDLNFLQPTSSGYHLDLTAYGLAPETDETTRYSDLSYYRDLRRAYGKAFTDAGIPAQPAAGYDTHCAIAADLAASAQLLLQRCLISVVAAALEETGATAVCLAGGVALNCTTNGILARTPDIESLFVQPAASDAGCALGAALECAHRRGERAVPGPMQTHALLGPSFDNHAIETALHTAGVAYNTPSDIAVTAARLLAEGKVIGWHHGRAEAGPRALGARSILADPRTTALRDRINLEIKRREFWRPLAPSMLELGAWTTPPSAPAEFMIVAHDATPSARQQIPGVVHVDGTMRPQRVDPGLQPAYARLIQAFEAETGIGVVLNTSFNGPGEPIVHSPADALRSGARLGLDAIVIGDYLITSPQSSSTRPAGQGS
ncbi:carbamoyltransferase C-terminal domain-containing protein [Nocardia gipuzkoensis]